MSMMPFKYPYLYPISIDGYPHQLYKKLFIHKRFNRKTDHHRFFRVDFDSQGNVLLIDPETTIKHIVVKREELLPQIKKPT